MNNETFYKDLDFKYPEIGIALSEGYGTNINVYIPSLMPLVENGGKDSRVITNKITSKSNIINKGTFATIDTKSSNYIPIYVASYLGKVYKGDKLVIVFIAGDPNEPVVIGRYA